MNSKPILAIAALLLSTTASAEPTFQLKPNESQAMDASLMGMTAAPCTVTPNQGPLRFEVTQNPKAGSNTVTVDEQKINLGLLTPVSFQAKRSFAFCAGTGSKMTLTNRASATVTVSCQDSGLVDTCN
jgi:hypothetical protein